LNFFAIQHVFQVIMDSSKLTYLATDAILVAFATETGSNHTGTPDSAATRECDKKKKRKKKNETQNV